MGANAPCSESSDSAVGTPPSANRAMHVSPGKLARVRPRGTPRAWPCRCRSFTGQAALYALTLSSLVSALPVALADEAALRYAGIYRIDDWEDLKQEGIRHTFILEPGGRFVLAAEWPGREDSSFSGSWTVGEGEVVLRGKGEVRTNQGDWSVDYIRTFRIGELNGRTALTPVPEKNRFGLLGWPNPFILQE